ncbi:hypothetical protein, partial [Sphingomonas sp. CROZ-RG-20F-R02-07]|uniref:hypothetical protein n=1 Tax=Sphingomonas sp. CROZ-RG-20F-R02-07 TaxID=2914832 RepID=UPI001F5754A7
MKAGECFGIALVVFDKPPMLAVSAAKATCICPTTMIPFPTVVGTRFVEPERGSPIANTRAMLVLSDALAGIDRRARLDGFSMVERCFRTQTYY